MTYNNSYVSSTPLVTIGSKSYYFGDIFTESTMSGNCNGTQCIVSCSCKAGWTTLSTSYSTRAAASGAYVAVTAPRKYADGTPTCRKSVSCADYGYVSSCPTGQVGTSVTVQTDGSDLKCYKDCKASYYSLQVHVSFSAGTGLSIQNNNTSAKITVNGESKTVTPTSASAVFSNLPAGTYTVSGRATIAVRKAAGHMYFCAFSTDSQLSDSKTVTIPSTTSTSLSFSCNTGLTGCPDGFLQQHPNQL